MDFMVELLELFESAWRMDGNREKVMTQEVTAVSVKQEQSSIVATAFAADINRRLTRALNLDDAKTRLWTDFKSSSFFSFAK